MKNKNKKYDIIIYSSLVLALMFIVLGYWDNLKDLKNEGISFSLKEEKTENKTEEPKDTEPNELIKVDKKDLVKKYLDSLLDQIQTDTLITYDIISSWGKYEVLNINYNRKIADNYYSYIVDLKISNKSNSIAVNKKLSTKEYDVITLNVNIAYSITSKCYIVKKIDIPAEN